MITEEQKIERLKQLRRVVEAAPEDRLHMRTFCEQAECGTAYCAAGWAAIDPWFRENTEIEGVFEYADDGHLFTGFGVWDVFDPLADIFGISRLAAGCLFGYGMSVTDEPHAVTKAEVLANIDRLLRGLPAERYAVIERRRRLMFL